jgi:uncharacterized protein YecA (UPF0149 family)
MSSEQIIRFEDEYPDAGQLLSEICKLNSLLPKKDRMVVDFDTGEVKPAIRRVVKGPGRNDPCTCGSGKKFKKCCLNK